MFQLWVIFLGLTSTVLSRDCKKPNPVENFSVEKFSGDWVIAGIDVLNATEAPKYKGGTCGIHHFRFDNGETKPNNWSAEYIVIGGKTAELNVYFDLHGSYIAPNPKVGFYKLTYPARNIDFDFTVMGTDYTTWGVFYCCSQLAPGKTSEFVVILARDLDNYEEKLHSDAMKQLYKQVSDKPVQQIRIVPHDNCPEKTHGARG